MRQYKRILSLLLALMMALALVPPAAWAADDIIVTQVVPCKYDEVHDFCEGFAAVKVGEIPDAKWGFIDTTGKEVIPCRYGEVQDFCGGFAAVMEGTWPNGKYGFIDTTGKEVVPCRYYQVGSFQEGLAVVRLGSKYGFVDTTGNEAIPCQYLNVSDFSEGLAAVANRSSWWGFIDTTGKEVIPFQYGAAYAFSGGVAEVYQNAHKGFIDAKGKAVIPFGKYDDLPNFSQDLIQVQQYGKWGFIDATDQNIIPCQYTHASNFSEGLAAVSIGEQYVDEKWGFIDKAGKEVVPCQYDEVRDFCEGFAAVMIGEQFTGKWGFLSIANSTAPAINTAYASTQTVNVDGKDVTFECYALKDEKGNPTNYIKLRDLAMLLNGSAAQFQVGWDGSVTITTETAYTPNGSELSTPYSGDRTYQESSAVTKINGQVADLAAFMLTDDRGGGYTYYQLRDLGQALGFNVGWSSGKGIFIETDKPYDPNN